MSTAVTVNAAAEPGGGGDNACKALRSSTGALVWFVGHTGSGDRKPVSRGEACGGAGHEKAVIKDGDLM
jgi:hypothetical protein